MNVNVSVNVCECVCECYDDGIDGIYNMTGMMLLSHGGRLDRMYNIVSSNTYTLNL